LFHWHRGRTIGSALVILPLIIASMGMLWGNSRMLDGISTSVDAIDQERNWQAVQAAFNSEVSRIASVLTDNAMWDDAVDHTYEHLDINWLLNNWGFNTADGNYDSVFVVDAAGSPTFGFQNGKQSTELPLRFYGNTFKHILSELPRDTTTFAISQSLTKTKIGVATIAVAPILPHSSNRKLAAARTQFLVFSKTIRGKALQTMGEEHVIHGLQYIDPFSTAQPHYVLKDKWGSALSTVTWTPSKLGNLARNTYFWSSLGAVAVLLATMAPVAMGLSHTLSKLEKTKNGEREMARKDPLSGLPNRLYFFEVLQSHLDKKTNEDCALMLIDLDGFKLVNDAFDHATGDRLIRAVAAGLQCLVDENCIVARMGGDEFAIAVFADDAKHRAANIAKNIVKFVADPFDLDGRYAAIGASIGIASAEHEPLEAQELMRRADIAMYSIKERGGNGHRNYEQKLDSKNSEDVSIADELRELLNKGDFDLNYQPLVSASTGEIIGLEALARWPQSSPNRYPPDRFIAVAEQFGLIDVLSALLMRKAFHDAQAWPTLRLSVNISPLQLNNRNLVSDIETAAQDHGFALSRLEVEFTEAVLIKNTKSARRVIRALKLLGVSVALDDFGSGYASVGYLRNYSFDTIKLDRSLTSLTSANAEALMVVQGAVLIAKGLSAKVVAEGVETAEEAQIMRLAGCEILQGYYFSKPQPASGITALLHEPRFLLDRLSA
jgi:diguanylate cyclase (GGDEF)-like protein